MPLYEFRCPDCGPFEQSHPMTAVPAATGCIECDGPAPRRVSAPRLGHLGSPEMALLDRTARSAHEPDTVSAPPPRRRSTPMSTDPRHRTLPRP
ncbi:FmdB family zinc ribbon protein [Rhodococcus sp. NPDC058532]|uniref:FmdB family zinc ribbon protein n=1 Tax=Rhodococcus sp. NPDC058532 TaxID=3346540 RepID=UPI0036506A4B